MRSGFARRRVGFPFGAQERLLCSHSQSLARFIANFLLSPEQIERLDEVSAIPSVFPYTVLNAPETRQGFTGGKLEQFDAPAEPVA
jgi:hypothetical protein